MNKVYYLQDEKSLLFTLLKIKSLKKYEKSLLFTLLKIKSLKKYEKSLLFTLLKIKSLKKYEKIYSVFYHKMFSSSSSKGSHRSGMFISRPASSTSICCSIPATTSFNSGSSRSSAMILSMISGANSSINEG